MSGFNYSSAGKRWNEGLNLWIYAIKIERIPVISLASNEPVNKLNYIQPDVWKRGFK